MTDATVCIRDHTVLIRAGATPGPLRDRRRNLHRELRYRQRAPYRDLQQRVQLETILAAYGDSAGAIPAAAIPALTAGLGRLLDDVHRRSEADMYRILRTYAAQIAARLNGGERSMRQ